MPERQSPFDDSLADLYGRLPDPHSTRTPDEDARPAPTSGAGAGAPMSRRAARAAAATSGADASGADAQAPEPATAEGGVPAPAAPSSAPAAAAPAAAPAVPQAAPRASVGDLATSMVPAAQGDDGDQGAPGPRRTPTGPPAAATATLDELFGDGGDGTGAPPRGPRKRRSGRIGGVIILGVILLLIGGVAGGAWFVWTQYEEPIRALMGWEEPKDYEPGEATGEVLVTVVSGDNGASISETLYNSGVTKTSDAFYDYLIETQQNPDFQPGVFALQQKMTSAAALTAILDPASRRENTAQLREGLTVEQSLPLLSEQLTIALEDFQAAVANPADYGVAASSLEGWLFPATYTFDPGVTAGDVIRQLVDRTVESLDTAGVPAERRQEILTVASIVEREGRAADFPKVARVIYNRLSPDNDQTSGLLQMDSTAQYGYGEMHDGTVSSSAEALADDNPWNTYVHPGLPAGPIANPGDAAIDAAMHPAEGPWMYFVTVNLETGETIFTNTADEHAQAVEQWQEWCAANPDGGC